jgi:Domain of unknown function (DUF4873)
VRSVRSVVVGGGSAGRGVASELTAAGISDFVVLDKGSDPGCEIVGATFDDDTDTWTLRTSAGETVQARVVIAAHRGPFVPWMPQFDGGDDFRGVSFHAADWDADFDPAGKRVAVVGTDSAAGYHLDRLNGTAAAVTVFAHAPRWVVTRVSPWVPLRTLPALRRLRGRVRPRRGPSVVASPIAALTTAGIRTDDGVEHRADAIVYGTGFAIPDTVADDALVGSGGLTIRQAWRDGMEPYLGVAVHGFPNYFFVGGPDIGMQVRYIAHCVGLLGAGRIEVLRSSQQVFNDRAQLGPPEVHGPAKAFDLAGAADDEETYDGVATLTIAGAPHSVRVRLKGHLDPIDGHYHWQGTVVSAIPDDALKQTRAATLTVGDHSAPARIVEQTPWGTHSIAGVGGAGYHLIRA